MNVRTVSQRTVYSRRIAAIETWEDAINLGVTCVEERDKWSWALGELASYIRTSTLAGGRPVGGDRQGTISAFADAIGIRRESLSAMCWNWEFFQDMRDELPENVTWYQLGEARRRSGWRPGMEIAPEHQERAAQFANEYADGGRPKVKRALSDVIADERDRLTGIADRADTPAPVAGLLRAAGEMIGRALEWFGPGESANG